MTTNPGLEAAVAGLVAEGASVVLHVDGPDERTAAAGVPAARVLDAPARGFDEAQSLLAALVDELGGVQALLLPVPPRRSAGLADLDPAVWADDLGRITQRSTAFARAFARHRVAAGGGGHVVTFSSSAVFEADGVGQASLNAAVLSLTSGVATTLAPHGVAVNCVVLGGDGAEATGLPVPSGDDHLLAPLVAHLLTVDPSFTGKFVYCGGSDVGIYAMPLVIEQSHVLVHVPESIDAAGLGEVLAPLADVGRV